MAPKSNKKITGKIKLQIEAGKANPAPPVGPALGQKGVNIMDFCKQFNERTAQQRTEARPSSDEYPVYSARIHALYPELSLSRYYVLYLPRRVLHVPVRQRE